MRKKKQYRQIRDRLTGRRLLVLPSQRYHAHIEHLLRREKGGQPLLFPEYLHQVHEVRRGTLFEGLLPRP